jgi:hypothetical protein
MGQRAATAIAWIERGRNYRHSFSCRHPMPYRARASTLDA